ncbi:MAG: amino-acid N-acetyltransferase [Spiribacter sp.]|nr:amino-acid N-acetyltransferase [Spiribacter sp.]
MQEDLDRLVSWFRHSSPFIHAHRGRTFVVSFGGEALSADNADALVHDLALLSGLGVRLVLVPGARPQIEARLNQSGAAIEYVDGRRVTNAEALRCVQDAVGHVRLTLEALFSMGLANSPMAGTRVQVAAGNFVTARPLGVRNGVDYAHTGEVRRIDADAINARLDDGAVVVVSPLGVSPTGEQFNLYAEDVAVAVAQALSADKLLFLHEGDSIVDRHEAPVRELTIEQARAMLSMPAGTQTSAEGEAAQLTRAISACQTGVARVHLLPRALDGALLGELFTRDGVGTLITAQAFERMRTATLDDISGILALIGPLESDGTLVERTRDRIETQIDDFTVMSREGTVVACAALQSIPETRAAEVACLVVHPDYQDAERGQQLLNALEAQAQAFGCEQLFVLTTRTAHWFQEQGFAPAEVDDLPVSRQAFYNQQRQSKVFVKTLLPG